MAWIMINGIRVKIQDGASAADYGGLIAQATAEMIHFRETWGDDEVFSIAQRGRNYKLLRLNGEDTVIMGPVPREPERLIVRPVRLGRPETVYMPAFHTVDEDGTWMGLTICLSGKWGPPFRFVQCEKDEVYPFEYGQWNINEDSEKPEDYEDNLYIRTVTSPYPTDGTFEDLYEVPAVHLYTGGDTDSEQEAYYNQEWSGGGIITTPICGVSYAEGYIHRHGTHSSGSNYKDYYSVWEDFNKSETQQPRLLAFPYGQDRAGVFHRKDGDVMVSGKPVDSTACIHCNSLLADTLGSTDWGTLLAYAYSYEANTISWNVDETSWGQTLKAYTTWSTFAKIDIEEGVFFYGLTNVSSGYNHWGTGTIQSNQLSRTGSGVEDWKSDTCEDHISVLGKDILLRRFNGVYYTEASDYIKWAAPRIYGEKDNRIVLASMYRESKKIWEYFFFGGEVEQYGDEDTQYEHTGNHNRHIIPFKVGDQQLYGNGEFSLVGLDLNQLNELNEVP